MFHRVVFKGMSFEEALSQAHKHLMALDERRLAKAIREIDPYKPPPFPLTSGFTELFWGKLVPWPHNDGKTHYIRVKWYESAPARERKTG